MSELQAQAAKLIDARNSLEQQLIKVHQAIQDSITAKERGARVEGHISKCQQLADDIYKKNDQLLKLAQKTDDPDKSMKELDDWLDEFAARNDHFLDKARQYIDARKQSQHVEQESHRSKRSSRHSKQSSRSSRSVTVSQYQRALELAKQKTDELVLQSDATLKIAEQKRQADQLQSQADFLVAEQKRQAEFVAAEQKRRADELRLQAQYDEVAEQQRQKIAAAKLAEAELENLFETASSNVDSSSSVPSAVEDKVTRTNEWVDNDANQIVLADGNDGQPLVTDGSKPHSNAVPVGDNQNTAVNHVFDQFTPVANQNVVTPIHQVPPVSVDSLNVALPSAQAATLQQPLIFTQQLLPQSNPVTFPTFAPYSSSWTFSAASNPLPPPAPINIQPSIPSGVSCYNSAPFTYGGTTFYHQNPLPPATPMGVSPSYAPTPPTDPVQSSSYLPAGAHSVSPTVVPTGGVYPPSANLTMNDLADLLSVMPS